MRRRVLITTTTKRDLQNDCLQYDAHVPLSQICLCSTARTNKASASSECFVASNSDSENGAIFVSIFVYTKQSKSKELQCSLVLLESALQKQITSMFFNTAQRKESIHFLAVTVRDSLLCKSDCAQRAILITRDAWCTNQLYAKADEAVKSHIITKLHPDPELTASLVVLEPTKGMCC